MRKKTNEALVRVILPAKQRRVVPEPKWKNVWKNCPCPDHTGENPLPVLSDFGIVVKRGKQQAGGWCKACKAKTNYHNRPRKNRSKNWPGPEAG